MEKFSKGDWVVEKNSAGSIEVVSGVNGWSECGYLCIGIATEGKECTNNKKTRANANLIAAAPKAYYKLKEVEQYLGAMIGESSYSKTLHDEIINLLAECRGEHEQVK